MPLPTPHDDEKEDEFLHRCMASDAVKEFDDQKQRVAVCYSQWREKHGGKKPEAKSRRLDIQADVVFEIEGAT